ncbi:HET-domain-containing protein, partial [Parathielavia hyrcaniae]
MEPVSIYSPLDSSKLLIRLLAIQEAAEDNDPLVCQITPVDLENPDNRPEFAALSYVWGSPQLGSEVMTLGGKPCTIGANLALALRFFRASKPGSWPTPGLTPPEHIWVDALCINQADEAEKAVQVGRMAQIYRSAALVISHLGPGNNLARDGMETI